jgi:hypothetical protein
VRWKLALLLLQEDKSADQLDSDVLLVTVMVIVRNMLKLDYTMQVNCFHVSEGSFTLLLYILWHPNSVSFTLLIS